MTQYIFCIMEVNAKRLGGEGGYAQCGNLRTRREEGSKIGKSYGRLIWMAPYSKISITY